MKNFFFFFLVLILLMGTANAQEEAKYNFGSAQSAKELTIAPGDKVSTKLYFYNIHGNRITHISLKIGEAPKNWDVSIEPALHKTSVVVSGVTTTIEENLFVEPGSDVSESIPDDIPEGIEYISSPIGFVEAKPVKINIRMPENEKVGTVANIRINAVAEWLGQTGAAAITQSRSFDYTVTVASKEFTETVLDASKEVKEDVVVVKGAEKVKAEEEKAEEALIPTGRVVETEAGVPTSILITIIAVLVIIIGILAIFVFKKE